MSSLASKDGYKPSRAATQLGKLHGRCSSQAPRVTNTTAGQNVNQVLFGVGESMELLSNQVLDPFPSRIDGKINGFAWRLEVNNGVRVTELLLCFECAEVRKKGAG